MRDIGVQLEPTRVGEGLLISVSLLLQVDNHFVQRSTLDLFIPWPGLPVAMMHGAFILMEYKMNLFILFFLSEAYLYVITLYISSVENSRGKKID